MFECGLQRGERVLALDESRDDHVRVIEEAHVVAS